MREGARPSPSNQARVIDGNAWRSRQRENFRVNVIEAFDQPWKRALEGAVGGYWGIIDRATGGAEIQPSAAPSPIIRIGRCRRWPASFWRRLTFGAAACRRPQGSAAARICGRDRGARRFVPAVLFGWTIETVPVESFSVGSWLRSLAFAAAPAPRRLSAPRAVPPAGRCRRSPRFSAARRDAATASTGRLAAVLIALDAGRRRSRARARLRSALPRHSVCAADRRGAAVSGAVMVAAPRPARNARSGRDASPAPCWSLSAGYIVFNESFANWQAVWFCAGLLGLAVILLRARDAPG